MIGVRYSGDPRSEVEVSGTRADFMELREALLRFCKLKRPILEAAVDPTPAPDRVAGLRFVRTDSKIRVEVEGGRMLLSGRRDHLEALAGCLPCEAAQDFERVSFDAASRPDRLQPDSVPVIFVRCGIQS